VVLHLPSLFAVCYSVLLYCMHVPMVDVSMDAYWYVSLSDSL